jgi:cytochrome P450
MKFAYMEAVAILATLVRALKFRPNPSHRVEPNIRITLRPEGGMPLHVESREVVLWTDLPGYPRRKA